MFGEGTFPEYLTDFLSVINPSVWLPAVLVWAWGAKLKG